MKIFDTKINFFFLLAAVVLIGFSSCHKEEQSDDLTVDIVGDYNGEYREGDSSFTIIVSNVAATISKNSDKEFDMEMELVAGLVIVRFSADMLSKSSFTVNAFELDGDRLEGEGTLEGNLLDISFYEEGTSKPYASYIAEKQ